MKSTICTIFVGIFLVFQFQKSGAIPIDSIVQDEVNRRVHVKGAMDGNITLTSNSSLGFGGSSFVFPGETNDGAPVAIKFTSENYLQLYKREYEFYKKMNATTNKMCEKYGIPFIYHTGDFLNYKTMAMTKLDESLDSLHENFESFSRDTILIIFRDMIKALKFVHSRGIIHKDIKGGNIMTKGANVFLFDFNVAGEKGVITDQYKDQFFENYDMRILFSTMCSLADVQEYCFCHSTEILKSDNEIMEMKRELKKELLVNKIKYTELVEPFVEFCLDAIEAQQHKRLPKYDYFYKMFDDLLYTGRNRSQRIVFEWLTPAEKATAMTESISSIESIVFPED